MKTLILLLLVFTLPSGFAQSPEKIMGLLRKLEKTTRKQAELMEFINSEKPTVTEKANKARELYMHTVFSVLPVVNKTFNETVSYYEKAKQKNAKNLFDMELIAIYLKGCRKAQKNIIRYSKDIYSQVSEKNVESSKEFIAQRMRWINLEYYRFKINLKEIKIKVSNL